MTSQFADANAPDAPSLLKLKYPRGVAIKASVAFYRSGSDSYDFHNEDKRFGPSIRIKRIRDSALEVLTRLRNHVTLGDLGEEATQLLLVLDSYNLLRAAGDGEHTGTIVQNQIPYLAEFVPDPERAQARLEASRVTIIGCGGTGNVLVQHLTAAGVRQFHLIDGDRVAISNLNRQLCFARRDLNRPKVEALRDYVLDREPRAKIRLTDAFIDSAGALRKLLAASETPNLIVCCADTPPVEIENIVLSSVPDGAAALFGNVGVHTALLGPLAASREGRQAYANRNRRELSQGPSDQVGPTAASFGATNTIAGALIAKAAIEYLAGIENPYLMDCQRLLSFHDMTSVETWSARIRKRSRRVASGARTGEAARQ